MKVTISSAQKRKTFSVRRCGFRQDRCGNTDTRPHKFCSALQYFAEFYNFCGGLPRSAMPWQRSAEILGVLHCSVAVCRVLQCLDSLCGAPWSFTMFCGALPRSAMPWQRSAELRGVLQCSVARFAMFCDVLTALCGAPWSFALFCGALPRSAMPWQCSAEFREVL